MIALSAKDVSKSSSSKAKHLILFLFLVILVCHFAIICSLFVEKKKKKKKIFFAHFLTFLKNRDTG